MGARDYFVALPLAWEMRSSRPQEAMSFLGQFGERLVRIVDVSGSSLCRKHTYKLTLVTIWVIVQTLSELRAK